MKEIFYIVHVLVSTGLIGLVLIQHGKGADAGAAFGSGASSTVFGSQGSASFLTRTTAILATAFFLSSLVLAYMSSQTKGPESVISDSVTNQIPVNPASEDLPPVVPATEAAPASDLPPVTTESAETPAAETPAVETPAAPAVEAPAEETQPAAGGGQPAAPAATEPEKVQP